MPIKKMKILLKEKRIKRNLSLETLKLSNIFISTFSKIKNNKIKKINSVFIYRICKVLNIFYGYVTTQRWDILPIFLFERKPS